MEKENKIEEKKEEKNDNKKTKINIINNKQKYTLVNLFE